MSLTDKQSVITQAMVDILEAEKLSLGVKQVFDGDVHLVTETPTVCVVAGSKSREMYATGVMTKVDVQVSIMVYHNRVQEIQKNQREVMELSEAIEELFHRRTNQTLDGLVIFGMFTSIDPGYADRQGSILRTTRLTWEAQSRHQLPTS